MCNATAHPDGKWVTQQAKNFLMDAEERGMGVTHLVRDRDGKFACRFNQTLKSAGVDIHAVGPKKPNVNADAERFVQTMRKECLDHFIIIGEKHLNHIVHEFVDYYNRLRPHQGKGNVVLGDEGEPPAKCKVDSPIPIGDLCRESRLGGVITHYYRRAA